MKLYPLIKIKKLKLSEEKKANFINFAIFVKFNKNPII